MALNNHKQTEEWVTSQFWDTFWPNFVHLTWDVSANDESQGNRLQNCRIQRLFATASEGTLSTGPIHKWDGFCCQGIRQSDQEVEFLVQQVRHLCHERKSIRQDRAAGESGKPGIFFFLADALCLALDRRLLVRGLVC